MPLTTKHNGWTGGQYSLYRALLGFYLFVHFAYLMPWAIELFSRGGMLPEATVSPLTRAFPNILSIYDAPGFVTLLAAVGAGAALAFAVGWRDRIAALVLWYILACFLGRNPLTLNPSLPYTGWLLLAHAMLPIAPFGAWMAHGRTDPACDWHMPQQIFTAAWIVMALSYSYSGYTKLASPSWISGESVSLVLQNPLARDWWLRDLFVALPPFLLRCITWLILLVEISFAPLALSRRLRPWLWSLMFGVQLGFATLLSFPDLTIAMLLFHLLTLDPKWLPARSLRGVMILFDGSCALCHATVRFLLAEDTRQELTFAPIGGATYRAVLGDIRPPDSLIVHFADGRRYFEADAVLLLLEHFGGLWRVVSWLCLAIPRSVRNRAYRLVGRNRYRLFGTTVTNCPRLAARLQARVLA
jgi:predicted DCC family thiol-disulfide oxidoreductase YuxK